MISLLPGEYLHSEGCIQSIVLHLAGCKFIYGSAAYRNLEIRWRDVVARLESFWPDWEATKDYMREAHDYWLASWAEETDPERPVMRFDGQMWPSWKILTTVIQHDSYHAGQIQIFRATVAPSSTPPPAEGDLWRKYCGDLPTW